MPSPFSFRRPVLGKPSPPGHAPAAGRSGVFILMGLLAISALGSIGIILYHSHKPSLTVLHGPGWDRRESSQKPEFRSTNRIRQPIGDLPEDPAPPSTRDQPVSHRAGSPPAAGMAAQPEPPSSGHTPDAPSGPGLPTQPAAIQDLTVKALTFERGPRGEESIFIEAGGPFRPEVFPLQGKNPFGSTARLVVDVKGVSSVEGSVSGSELNGRIIRRVRTSFSPDSRSFRAVLDLEAGIPFIKTEEMSPDGRRFAVHITGQEESAPDKAVRIRHIAFRPGSDSEDERLLIQADRFFEPLVFGLEGANPYGEHNRIVVDIKGVLPLHRNIGPVFENGRLVRDVRRHYYGSEGRLRIVLDLAPASGYEVSQMFFEEQNLYTLSLKEDKDAPVTAKSDPAILPEKSSEPADPEQLQPFMPATVKSEAPGPQARPLLRSTPLDLTERQIRAALLMHGFYSTCGIYNAEYCNPNGSYTNRYFDCLEGAVCDEATGLMWEKSGSERPLTWDEAGAYIADLNRSRAAGYGDWRLPTIEELLSIMENSWRNGGLFIDDRFDTTPRTCWSRDTSGSGKAWKANFHLGYVVDSLVEERNWVKAVRTLEPSLPGPGKSPERASTSGGPGGDPIMAGRDPG